MNHRDRRIDGWLSLAISQEEGEGAPGMEENSYNPLGERPLQSKSPAGKEKVSRLFIQDVFHIGHPAEA